MRSPFESITYLQQSLERRTYKLQKRIYQASSRGDVKAIRRLQKTLMNSWSAKCIAVRRVTQDNNGKNTAGVDGIKSIKPSERLNLVKRLKLTGKSKPTRRLQLFPKTSKRVNGKKTKIPSPTLIRYADDFVIIHSELSTVQKCLESISEWLEEIGLKLKPSKTKLTHTFIP